MKGIIRTSMEPGFDVAKINKILIIREWLRTPQRGNTTGQLNNSLCNPRFTNTVEYFNNDNIS